MRYVMLRVLIIFCLTMLSVHATQVVDLCNLKIKTPSLQERCVRKLRLDNGLEVLLISDPGTPQSGAALAVNVGSWDDPQDRPGMAHFVEHLLFLGTHTYPEEGGYSRYLHDHGGLRNAFTMSDRTVYFFSVNHDGFEGVLDRFGHFFIDPLFNPSGVQRECCAIHQEFCKNIPLDPWRLMYVQKAICSPAHPFHDFCIGNLETLANISQDELKAWYQKHYGAQIMHLVVLSPQDLDTLEAQVTSLFSQVKRTEFTSTEHPLPPLFDANNKGMLLTVAPVQHTQQLELAWEIPNRDLDTASDRLIGYLLGHESQGSLLALLKEKQLADGLSAGSQRIGKNQTLFTLHVQLTDLGVKDYETVISYCFQALAAYRLTGIPSSLFEELVELENLRYGYQSREDVTQFLSSYAAAMIDESLDTFPQKTFVPTHYAKDQIEAILTALTPQNCQFSLMASADKTRCKLDRKEPWFGVPYTTKTISKKKLKQWSLSAPHSSIELPPVNLYVPKKFALETEETVITPVALDTSHAGHCYVCTDQEFGVPQVSWSFTVKTPSIIPESIKSQVLADLFCYTVTERLVTESYLASLGGLSLHLSPEFNGLKFVISGFHDKAPLFTAQVLHTLTATLPTKEEFALSKERAEREYAQACTVSSLTEARELLMGVLYQNYASAPQKRRALNTISYDDMKAFAKHLWDKTHVDAMLYGNVTQASAKQVWLNAIDHFQGRAYPVTEQATKSVASFAHSHMLEHKSRLQGNAVILAADFGEFSFKKRAALDILCKALEEPFFSELRTKQQTAYLVHNWGQDLERHLYAFFAVQSSSHDTRDLLARFELFLESHLRDLPTTVLPQERFEAIREACIALLKHPADNLQEKGLLLHRLAFEHDGDFAWLDKRIAALEALCFEEVLDVAQQYLGSAHPKRLAICVNGEVPEDSGIHYQVFTSQDKLRKLLKYKEAN